MGTTAVRQLTDESPESPGPSSRGLHHRQRQIIHQMSRDESGRASSSGFHSTSSSNINLRNQSGPIRSSSTISVDKNRNNGNTSSTANQVLNSIETNSISSTGSH